MKKYLYVVLMEDKNKLNIDVICRHVEYLKTLEKANCLVICGPFLDYQGGMVILDVDTYEEAKEIANLDPFILEGYKTYQLRTLEVANNDNNYLI